jgi:dCMP deaminase
MKDWVDKWDPRFLEMASLVASWSKDPSTKTGAVITNVNNTVIATGYNGFPYGMSDDPELYANRDEKYSRIIHCEMNAIMRAGKLSPDSFYTLYTWPFMSCDRCVVHMLQAGITRFVAPKMPQDKADRWKDIMDKATKYINEVGGELILL